MKLHLDHKVQIAALIADKVLITVLAEYIDFKNVFSKKSATILPEYTKINTYAFNLKKSNQPPYRPIYSQGPVELKTLKTYIKTNLANSFICPSKSIANALILFDKKLNGSL